MINIIGIGGTNGSGKDTLGEILADDYGYLFISVSDLLREEAKKRGLPIEREVLRTISAEWRRKYGVGVLVDKAVELFERSAVPMRNPGEAQHIKDLGGTLVWVDANPKLRYQRIYSRQRSSEDKKTFEQFLAEEQAEMDHHGGDDATLNMAGVKAKADIFITNDSDDVETFKKTAQKALGL
jgi:cytidylate kinase